jgi:hypothetical protein
MKRVSIPFIVGAGLIALLSGSLQAQDEIRSALEKRTTETRTKIGDLFDHRDTPIPPTDSSLNPFYRESSMGVAPPPATPEEDVVFVPPPRKEAELLEAIAGALRINGIVTYNNRDLIVINQTPTLAGRMITVEFEGKTHFVRVEEIFSNRVVLSLGSAFTVLPIAVETETSGAGAVRQPAP